MLDEQKDIDAVIIATPDHTHAVIAMAAMERKKHVYVQKPLTHSVYEARLLTETARKYGVATQMGNQGHSGEGIRLLCEWVWDGAIGPIREAHAWTNRPVWPSGIEVDRPTDTAGGSSRPRLGPVARPGPLPPLPPHLSPRQVARLVGFRDRLVGRHGVPHRRSALLGAEAQVPDQRGGQRLEVLAGVLRGDAGEERDVSPVHHRALQVPGAGRNARGRRDVVGRGTRCRRAPPGSNRAGAWATTMAGSC